MLIGGGFADGFDIQTLVDQSRTFQRAHTFSSNELPVAMQVPWMPRQQAVSMRPALKSLLLLACEALALVLPVFIGFQAGSCG